MTDLHKVFPKATVSPTEDSSTAVAHTVIEPVALESEGLRPKRDYRAAFDLNFQLLVVGRRLSESRSFGPSPYATGDTLS